MNILILGKGGREHALVQLLAESPGEHHLYSYPGSDAICALAQVVEAKDFASLGSLLEQRQIDLCVVGEESYLIEGAGIAALCAHHGVPCWGPCKEAAQLEASKVFAKDFMDRHGIPTARCYGTAASLSEARQVISEYPVVLKYDGLAAGKGVSVCHDERQAVEFLETVFTQRRFGEGTLLIEECLHGPEVSIFAAVSDDQCQIFAPARDYKRLADGDEGKNTGGMGAVASRQGLIAADLLADIERQVVRRTLAGLKKDGLSYRGFLYFGLMLTLEGPKLLEYNCRFGDPEAQAVLPLLRGDFATYLLRAAQGSLQADLIACSQEWSVCVVLASHGYPDSSRSGDLISGLDNVENARIYHAGTRRLENGQYVTNGGRVLSIVAQGKDRRSTVETVYREAAKVNFPGMQRRADIGRLHFE